MAILRHFCSRDVPAPTVHIFCPPEDHKAWFAPLFEDITTAIRCNVSWQDPEKTFDPGLLPNDTDFVAAVVTTRLLAGDLSRIDALVKSAGSRKLPLLYVIMDDETGKAFPLQEGELPFLRRSFRPTAGLFYDEKLKRVLTAALTRQPCREAVRRYLAGDTRAASDIYELASHDPQLLLSLGCLEEADLALRARLDEFSSGTVNAERLELELLAADLEYRTGDKELAGIKFLKIFAMSGACEDRPPVCRCRCLIGLWQFHQSTASPTAEKFCKRAIHSLQAAALAGEAPRLPEMLVYATLDAAAFYKKDPGTHPRARRLYTQALSRQDRRLREKSTADGLLRYLRICGQFRRFLLDTGHRERARQLLSDLAETEAALSEEFGITEWKYRRELVRQYERLGDFCLLGQEFEEAEEQYQRAFAIAETIYRAGRQDEDLMLCSTNSNGLGVALFNQGLTAEAEAAYLRAFTLAQRLDCYGSEREYLRNLCDVAGNLADLYEQERSAEKAMKYYELCISTMGRLAELAKTPGQYRELAQWHLDYSQFLDSLGRREDTMLHHAKATALERRAENL